ncbi:binding-protein-dependent transport systems inner membrane component [Actinosynnema mirum DSM 43827]|uniref:Binding-protein-dependent transport systems inner membrane component n=1 Tax=Actinosynnema mirum (strain ATCC 29888 / DSM 43827 / JCM 3225 / NBRC 14064 / NCIMB 13271 / NRRL B-12336 / IMRU 3971 / 101) TaxID=446462 RepID=C6WA53_ACTMD|nr:binding-protein-dependent transport systems inner membrane component [Actinosynnema mirum DSM 43827]
MQNEVNSTGSGGEVFSSLIVATPFDSLDWPGWLGLINWEEALRVRALTRGLLGAAGFLVIWELFGRSGLVPQEYLPPPSVVAVELLALLGDETFLRDVVATVLALLISVLLSVGIAVPAGLVLGSVAPVRHATRAVVEFLRPIPSVALIPLAIVVLGLGPEMKIALAVYAAVWPILFNTIYALDELDPLLVDTARVFGASRLRVLLSVALPSALPFVFTGIRLSATTCLVVLVSVEMLAGGAAGIGEFVMDARSGAGRMDLVLAGTVVAGVLGYLVNEGLERAQRRWVGWGFVQGGRS